MVLAARPSLKRCLKGTPGSLFSDETNSTSSTDAYDGAIFETILMYLITILPPFD